MGGKRIMGDVAVRKTESLWDEVLKMEDRIMRRAYDIFRGNGSDNGKDLDNWLAAERELVWKPAIEMTEKDNQFEVKVAVAGVDPKDIQIEATPDGLLVKGETKSEKKEEKGDVITSEFQSGSLFRSIRFPRKIDADKVKADIKNGLLTVTAPVAENVKARKVQIGAA
jgi:HSP20 family molecular chaperone IbpA